jgi:hypothetical protein
MDTGTVESPLAQRASAPFKRAKARLEKLTVAGIATNFS